MHFLPSGGPSSVEADGMASRIRTRGTSSLQLPASVSPPKRCTTRSSAVSRAKSYKPANGFARFSVSTASL